MDEGAQGLVPIKPSHICVVLHTRSLSNEWQDAVGPSLLEKKFERKKKDDSSETASPEKPSEGPSYVL